MAHVLIHHEVADFAAWKPRADARPDLHCVDEVERSSVRGIFA